MAGREKGTRRRSNKDRKRYGGRVRKSEDTEEEGEGKVAERISKFC